MKQHIQNAIELLTQNGYKILEKYQPVSQYCADDGSEKFLAAYVDVEATGLDPKTEKIIELAIVVFEFSKDGRIFKIVNTFDEFQDPGKPIPAEIVKLTGITDADVAGKHIDQQMVENLFNTVQVIFAHNAKFDRVFIETFMPKLPKKPWGCTQNQIDWKKENIGSQKLDYIASVYHFYYEAHRAVYDCLAGIHILSKPLFSSGKPVLSELLENVKKKTYKLWAINAPFEAKDLLKSRKYYWSDGSNGAPKAWFIECAEEAIAPELCFLWKQVYRKTCQLRIDTFTALNRYSGVHGPVENMETDAIYEEATRLFKTELVT